MAFIDFPTFKKRNNFNFVESVCRRGETHANFRYEIRVSKGSKVLFSFLERGTEGGIRLCGKAIQRRSRTLTSGRFVRAEPRWRGPARFSLTRPHKSRIFISFFPPFLSRFPPPELRPPRLSPLPPFSYRIPRASSPKSTQDISFARLSPFVLANAAESRLSGKERRRGEIYRSCGLLRGL